MDSVENLWARSRLPLAVDLNSARPRPGWICRFGAALVTFCLAGGSDSVRTHAGSEPAGDSPLPAAARVLPGVVDLRREFDRWNLPRWQQGERPTCSAFTVAGGLEFAAAKRQGHGTRLSVEFLNWACNQSCGDRADGGFFSDLWKGFTTYGICTAEALPYARAFDPTVSPSPETLAQAKMRLSLGLRFHWIKEWDVNTGLTETHLSAIKETLVVGWPVCAGLRWPKQEQWIDDVLQVCPPDAVRDGHSVLLTGYREDPAQPGGGVFTFRNTANAGHDGAMPYAYAQAYMNDAAWIDYSP